MPHHRGDTVVGELLHDGAHTLQTLAASLLLLWLFAGLALPAFLLGAGVLGTGLELIFSSVREGKLTSDSTKDWSTYQAAWIVYFAIVGQWTACIVLTLVIAMLLYSYYTMKYNVRVW